MSSPADSDVNEARLRNSLHSLYDSALDLLLLRLVTMTLQRLVTMTLVSERFDTDINIPYGY